MPSRWRYLFYDLASNRKLAELPLSSPKLGGALNSPGDWSGTLALGDRIVRQLDPRAATTPGKTAMFVDRDGQLVYGGIVWQRSVNRSNSKALDLQGKEFLSYFEHRFIRARLAYSLVDQASILRSILAWAQGVPSGSIGVEYDSTLTGVLRDRTYEVFDVKQVLEAVSQIADLEDGPDIGIDPYWKSDGTPGKRMNIGWPVRGQQPGSSSLAITDRNSNSWTWQEDGSVTRNLSLALGSGDGDAMLIAAAAATELLDGGWPLLEGTSDYKDVTDMSTLVAHAAGDLAASAGIVVNPTFTIRTDREPYFGSWTAGDYFRISVSSDGLSSAAPLTRPGQYDGWLRLVSWSVDPATETAELTMGGVLLS